MGLINSGFEFVKVGEGIVAAVAVYFIIYAILKLCKK